MGTGLLERALQFRELNGMAEEERQSGISEEDQKDILIQIDKVAQANRINVSPELFTFKSKHKGFIFPLLVNILAALVLVSGLYGFSYFFRREEAQITTGYGAIKTAEGTLIQEVKRESEEQLKQKDREITDIQSRLLSIDQERNELKTTMDTKVREKEVELRKTMEAELEAERKRLAAQGMSEADIREQMQAIEEEKNAQFKRQLDEFSREAELERQRLEENLKKLQSEYQQSLASLNIERQKILDDAKKREEELRIQLEEKSRALATEQAKSEEQLTRAQAEIRSLAEQKERAELIENQVIGFYGSIRDSIQAQNYDLALQNIDNLNRFLSDETVAALPTIQKRREMDIAMMQILRSMVEGEKARMTAATAPVSVQESAVIGEIRGLAERAKGELEAGNVTAAESLYTEALSRIPATYTAYQYFVTKAATAAKENQQAIEKVLADADAAFRSGNYTRAAEQYGRALSYLPQTSFPPGTIASQFQRAGYETLFAEQKLRETRAAAALLASGDAAQTAGNFDAALASYISLIRQYPNSAQAPAALEGISRAVEGRRRIVDENAGKQAARIAELENDKLRLQADIEALKVKHEEDIRSLTEQHNREIEAIRTAHAKDTELKASEASRMLESQKEAYERQLNEQNARYTAERQKLEQEARERLAIQQNLESRIAELEAQLEASKAAVAGGEINIPTEQLSDEAKQELAHLSALAEEYRRIKESYAFYVERENQIIQAKGDEALIDTKLYLDAFLTTEEMRKGFPGLYERIKRYDRAFEATGRNDAILEVSDVVYTLNRLKTQDAQKAYLAQALERQKDRPEVTEFLKQLEVLIK